MKSTLASILLISSIQIFTALAEHPNVFVRPGYFQKLYNGMLLVLCFTSSISIAHFHRPLDFVKCTGTNWCASILVGLPYHIDTELLHSKELDSADMEIGVDMTDHHDLGELENVDTCCHSYQHCVQSTPVQSVPIENPRQAQHCDCELGLRDCLREIDTADANDFGRAYFYTSDQCVLNSYPVVDCEQYDTILRGTQDEERRCVRYAVDEDNSEEYQLIDLPFYYDDIERNRLNVEF